jgi:hypothetical protein
VVNNVFNAQRRAEYLLAQTICNEGSVALPTFDISGVVGQLRNLPECKSWTDEKLEMATEEYLKFLALAKKHPNAALVPSPIVDTIWHRHMLNSRQYMTDCQGHFGYYFHHSPHPRQEGGAKLPTNDWLNTIRLYEETFGDGSSRGWVMRAAECSSGGCAGGCSGADCGGSIAS